MSTIIQLTGLSGTGKTTLSNALFKWGEQHRLKVRIIDGDVFRQTLCKDLGFSKADRLENISRLGAYAASVSGEYDLVCIAAINPYEEGREHLRLTYGAILVWLRCNLETLISRDPKGLYRKALLPDGHPDKIHNLTGLNDTFEEPARAELILDTGQLNPEEALEIMINFLKTVTKVL
jgi:adenylylsulfate kinase